MTMDVPPLTPIHTLLVRMLDDGRPPIRAEIAQVEMEFRDLQCFVTVTEASGFRRAATRLGTSQSVVSRRVRDLEDELGVSLFERNQAGVRLTHAGHHFLDDVRMMFSHFNAAVRSASATGRAGEGTLRIGVVASISTSFLNRLIRAWRIEHPNVVLDFNEGDAREHIASILERRADITFVTGTPAIIGCDVEALWSEPIIAALPNDHAFAGRGVLDLQDAVDQQFIVSKTAPGPEIHDYIVKRLSAPGLSPRIQHFGIGREALMSLVGLGFGMSLVSGAEAGVVYPGVTFVPIAGESLPFSAVWSPDNDNPALRNFLSAARVLARKTMALGAPSRTLDPSP